MTFDALPFVVTVHAIAGEGGRRAAGLKSTAEEIAIIIPCLPLNKTAM